MYPKIAVFFAALIFLTSPASAEKRVALVIGNGAYRNAPSLPNPHNDAEDVAAALKRTGFDVIVGLDLDKAKMDETLIEFSRAARSADVAAIYYSGHAIQFNGANYLAPVDVKLTDEADLRRMTRLDEVVADLQQAQNLRILVLDACRDNPLAEQLKRSIGTTRALTLQRGLAKMDSSEGMIVSYATQAGRTAIDGTGRNSPYTAAFLNHIEESDEIGTIFRRIASDVYDSTKHAQLPELSLSVVGEFFLRGRPAAVAAPNPPLSELCTAAADHWKSAASIGNRKALEDHLARFPNCAFSGLAKARLESLKVATAAPLVPPVPAPTAPAGTSRMTLQQAITWCNNRDRAPPEMQINGCTKYIESGRQDRNLAFAYNNRGLALFEQQSFDAAIDDYNEAIKLNPKDTKYYNNRGNAFDSKAQYDRAISDYTQAIGLDPRNVAALSNRGRVSSASGKIDSLSCLTTVLKDRFISQTAFCL
jgi:tetratricopeptide (TPR) repeat protein